MRRLATTLLAWASAATPAFGQSRQWTLPELVAKARANDLRVQEAEADLRVLQGKAKEARWAGFPKLEGTALIGGPTPEARNDGLGGPPSTPASFMYDLDFGHVGVMVRTELTAFLPVYTFGKLSALADAGKLGVQVGEGLRERVRDEVGFQAAQAYFGYQLARQGRDALADTLKRLDDASATLQKLLGQRSSQVSQLDLHKVTFFRKQVEARAGQVTSGAALASSALRLMVGTSEKETFEIETRDLPETAIALAPLETYLHQAEAHRPELRAIAAGIAAREKEVFIRERLFYPDLGLVGFARWMWTTSATRQRSPFAYDPYNDLGSGLALVGRMTFDLPIKQAQLDQSRAELEKLSTQRQLLVSAIRLELEKLRGEVQEALTRATAQTEAERSARRWATAAYASFELGTGDTRELVDAFTALAMASGEKLKAWFDVQVGLQALARAAGQPLGALPAPPPP